MENGHATAVVDKPHIDRHVSEPAQRGAEGSAMTPIERLLERLGPSAVFGEPVQAGEATIIPVVEVRTGFGFGGSQGRRAEPASEQAAEKGGGSGGGAGARVIPRGYLHITKAKVRYEPIADVTRLALAAMALAAGITLLIVKTRLH